MLRSNNLSFKEGYFEMLGLRGVILPEHTHATFIEEIYERSGDELYDILFETGKAHGKHGIDRVGRKKGTSKREWVMDLEGSANVMGLGKIEVDEFNLQTGKLVIGLTDPATVEELERKGFEEPEKPVLEFVRGIYHGMAEEIFETGVSSEIRNSSKASIVIRAKESSDE